MARRVSWLVVAFNLWLLLCLTLVVVAGGWRYGGRYEGGIVIVVPYLPAEVVPADFLGQRWPVIFARGN